MAATVDLASDLWLDSETPVQAERTLFRPSRTNYPGSKFGPKTRYDLPQRFKAYGNADESDTILFSGTALQPQAWLPSSAAVGVGPVRALPNASGGATSGAGCNSTPRTAPVFSDAARAMFHPLADKNLPELPLVDEQNSNVHGVLVLGGRGAGKTSLVLSILAAATGSYPSGPTVREKKHSMPVYGQGYELPEQREVKLADGSTGPMRILLTDTLPCGTCHRDEQPLCATVSPNSTQHFNAIPSWMRITMRSGNNPHYAVLFVVDATAKPLWEDAMRCRELARLLAVLKKNQYTVVIAVTKLLQARQDALRDVAFGKPHGGEVGKDPRSSYESFVGRYLEKVCAAIQAKAGENEWSFSLGPDSPPFPLHNHTIFDVPSWVSLVDYRSWQSRRGTPELPNLLYMNSQLLRLLKALSVRSFSG